MRQDIQPRQGQCIVFCDDVCAGLCVCMGDAASFQRGRSVSKSVHGAVHRPLFLVPVADACTLERAQVGAIVPIPYII